QREHYIAGWTWRIALLWYARRPVNIVLLAVVVVLGVLATISLVFLAALVIAIAGLIPIGLGVRGRSAPLAWTARAKRLVVAFVVLYALASVAVLVALGWSGLALPVLLAPLLMDLALLVMAPIEKPLSNKYLVSARKRLQQVRPTVVA